MAPQSFPASFLYESIPESGMSEDCLYLNVLTPAKKTNERLPVIVWFHGGGLTIGSSNPVTYNTGFIPQHGVVLVTVQHRLGPIGYMAHPALSAESPNHVSGNYGQLDLIAALQWVQRNIKAFGGNPENVTIIGQSGGGQKVLWLMASPLAKGLVHRVICQSGGIGGTPLATTEQYGLNLAAKLGVTGSGLDALAALRAKPWRDIIIEANKPGSGYSTVFSVDGWSMIDTGPNIFSTGSQNDVPLMIGYAGGEVSSVKSPYTFGLIPNIKQKSNVYVYLFTHVPKNWAEEGAFAWHGSDVAYEFGTQEILVKNLGVLLPSTLNPDPGVGYKDDWVADFMATTLAQFAATGDPNPSRKHRGHNWHRLFWPPYDSRDQYLDIGYPPVVGSGFSTLLTQQPPR
jgi:para-nitrobenzyl esterase